MAWGDGGDAWIGYTTWQQVAQAHVGYVIN
jgi:hypothetical protein